jgi:hypothetical protein
VLRWINTGIDWLGDMIARWINQVCSWWCTIPGWPFLTAALAIAALATAYAVSWSRA